ncbi:ABC-2 type transport system permease protein [Micrococcales bacterium KH10]|nr:ABC-2 type transport system permease protein [Micrococcales bacterium KH10]
MSSVHTTAPRRELSTAAATWLVAKRDIMAQIRSKSFLISTGILLVLVLGMIIVTSILSNRDDSAHEVAVVGQSAPIAQTVESFEVTTVASADEALALVRDGSVEAAILPSEETAQDPLGFYVVALDSTPESVVNSLMVSPRVDLLEPPVTSEGLLYLISFAFGIVFMMSAMTFGSMIAQNTVVEKQTRTVELLLSAVPAKALLGGKVIGNSILAIGQTTAIALTAIAGLSATGQGEILTMVGAPVVWFIGFFILGFILLAALFAGSASLVSRIEDTGSVLTPVIWIAMIPYFVVVFFSDNDLVMTIASYVPFSAPVAMPVRIFTQSAQWFEPLIALAILAVTAWGAITVASRVYQRTILRTGARVKLSEALNE